MSLQIRLAQQRDIAHLMAVERSAAQLFASSRNGALSPKAR